MSEFSPQLAAAERKPTPGTVKNASILQFAVFALSLVSLVLTLMYSGDMYDAAIAELKAQGAKQSLIDTYETTGNFSFIGPIVTVVLAGVYALMGVFNRRGSNGARITTWILSGIFLLCNLVLLAFTGVGGGTVDGVNMDKVSDAMNGAAPAWFGAWGIISMIILVVCYLGAIILLAMPASNEFFRKAPPQLLLPGDPIA